MDFLRSSGAHHAHDLAAGGAADDGVVDQNNALALKQITNRIQLELHAKVAHALLRLNERAPYIVVADETEVERDSTLRRISQGGGDSGVWHRHDQVGIDGRFNGQATAHLLAAGLYPAAKDATVRTSEIDVFENAARL